MQDQCIVKRKVDYRSARIMPLATCAGEKAEFQNPVQTAVLVSPLLG